MSWPVASLADVATINPRVQKDQKLPDNVTFLPMAAVSEEGEVVGAELRALEEVRKGFTYFERGDVLLAKITPCFENGKAIFLERLETQVGFGSTEFHVIRPDPKRLDGKFLFYLLWNVKFRHEGARNMTGSAGQRRVPTNFLERYTFLLPPLATQKYIARVLEQSDQLRKQAQQMERELNQLAQSLFLEMFGDPIGNPKNWAIRPLGEVANNLDGRRVPVKSSDRADKQGSYPYYGASGIIDYVDDFIFDEKTLLVAEDGANLLIRSTPIAFIAEGKYWVNNHAHVLSENGLARLEYIEYSLNLRDVSPYISGSAQPKLNQAMLNSIKIQCPPIELQDKFTDVLSEIRSEKASLLKKAELIEQMFNSLMQRAFNGELTAPERKAA